MNCLKKISCAFNYLVFAAATLTIAGVLYEGYALKWFDVVGGIFVPVTDFSFILATVINLIVEARSKELFVHIFSAVIIIIAIAMKALNIEYPTITLVIWMLYIWFLHGIRIVKTYMQTGKDE